jgi:hypothetical protein
MWATAAAARGGGIGWPQASCCRGFGSASAFIKAGKKTNSAQAFEHGSKLI